MKALIVGNGQSSINPEARSLIKERDIFRVNNFFLEPQPIFGTKIKFLSFIGLPYNLYLIDYLRSHKVYEIEYANYREMPKKYFFIPKLLTLFTPWKTIIEQLSLKNSVSGFDDMNMVHNKVQKHAKITSGVYLVNCAIQMGYKDLAIIGIDFYSEKSLKQYPIIIPDCFSKIAIFEGQFRSARIKKKQNSSYDTDQHSYKIDSTYMINLANQYPEVTITTYVDEKNPFHNWSLIAQKCPNVHVVIMSSYETNANALQSHCLQDIQTALLEYQQKYYWQDIWMRIRHLINYRKSVIKKFYLIILNHLHIV